MKPVFKFTAIFSFILLFLATSAVLGVFGRLYHRIGKDPFWLQKKRTSLQAHFCRLGLKILNVKTTIIGQDKMKTSASEARLMVGNHMSYLDILILSSIYPSSYVTSQEIRETPLLGILCEWAGCLFVERRSRMNLSREVSEIKEALTNGLTVTIFPEATSTNGEEILRFRAPLYQAAIDSGAWVQPFCLNYLRINKASFSRGNRDYVCWYGDMDFAPHLWALCRLESVDVSVQFLEALDPAQYSHPRELAEQTQLLVTEKFHPAV